MKKLAIFLICLAAGLCAVFGLLYKADLARMANNEPVIFSTWGYNYADTDEDTSADNEVHDLLYMEAEENTITSRGINMSIVNNSVNDVAFGDYYSIEKLNGGMWKKLNYITAETPDWNDMTYVIETGSRADFNFYWADMYGELEPGEYRMVKLYIDSSNSAEINYLYGYFTIK